jgi:hypothetical protein
MERNLAGGHQQKYHFHKKLAVDNDIFLTQTRGGVKAILSKQKNITTCIILTCSTGRVRVTTTAAEIARGFFKTPTESKRVPLVWNTMHVCQIWRNFDKQGYCKSVAAT